MPNTPKTSFLAGEVAPMINSGIETEKYQQGLKKCENYMVDVLDGIKNRPGLGYVADAYVATQQSRLIPFQFNEEQAYVIEFGHFRERVLRDGGLVLIDLIDTGFWTLSGFGTGEYYFTGTFTPPEPSFMFESGSEMPAGTLGSLSAGEWDWGDNGGEVGFDTIYVRLLDSTDPDTKSTDYLQTHTLLETPYTISEVSELEYTQSADTLYLFHTDHDIGITRRVSDSEWTINSIVPPIKKYPYIPRAIGDDEVTINVKYVSSATVDLYDLTANGPIFANTVGGDPIRLGFQVPGDPVAIHWYDFNVRTKSSDTLIRVSTELPGENPILYKTPITYREIQNPEFKQGLTFWEEKSAVADVGSITYNSANNRVVFTDPTGAGTAKMEQVVLTLKNTQHILRIKTGSFTGSTPRVTLNVGTTSLGSDIKTGAILLADTDYRFDILPTAEVIYVSFDSTGSTDGDTVELVSVDLYRSDTLASSLFEINTNEWRLTEWSAARGFPSVGAILGERLIAGNTATKPQTLWASELGIGEDGIPSFRDSTPGRSSDAFSFKPSTETLNGIRWIIDKDGIKVGTAADIWRVFAPSGGAISPTDIAIERDEAEGSLDLRPIVAHNAILMTPRGKSPVLELVSSLEAKGFQSRDIGIIANHLFKNRRIVRWAFAKDPDSVVWCILDNGQLLGLTYHRRLNVWGWHKHTCPLGEGHRDVVVIPNSSDDNTDDVYFLVNRGGIETTPGAFPDNFYIERLNRRITPQDAAFGLSASGSPDDYRFLDSSLMYDEPSTISGITTGIGVNPMVVTDTAHGYSDGDEIRIQNVVGVSNPATGVSAVNNVVFTVTNKTANTYELYDSEGNPVSGVFESSYKEGGESRLMALTLSGFDHLEGQAITVVADGVAHENLTVSSGSVTLPQKASFANGGVPYTPEAETLDIETIFESGGTQGRIKGVLSADIYFIETRGCDVYASNRPDKVRTVLFEDESTGENPPPLFDGVKSVDVKSDHKKQVNLVFQQNKPYPSHIRRVIIDVDYAG
jgi:hypothetical protein